MCNVSYVICLFVVCFSSLQLPCCAKNVFNGPCFNDTRMLQQFVHLYIDIYVLQNGLWRKAAMYISEIEIYLLQNWFSKFSCQIVFSWHIFAIISWFPCHTNSTVKEVLSLRNCTIAGGKLHALIIIHLGRQWCITPQVKLTLGLSHLYHFWGSRSFPSCMMRIHFIFLV